MQNNVNLHTVLKFFLFVCFGVLQEAWDVFTVAHLYFTNFYRKKNYCAFEGMKICYYGTNWKSKALYTLLPR